ncbi:MAG TPA: metal ABC transporter permease [Acidimicrobiales bacterium]|jgi:zinc/manganese transport system permease protein
MGLLAGSSVHLSWNLGSDLHQLFAFHFMVNALRAATITAIVAGAAGWFVVFRRQAFAGHTLSVVAFPGAAGATWLGITAAWGYFGFCVAAAVIISAVPYSDDRRGFSEEPAIVGVVQAFFLALGFLFVMLYKGFLNGVDALLFGTFLGVTDHQVVVLAAVGAAALAALAVIGRPLLFASVDPAVASASGVPVRALSVVFLIVLGVAVAEVSQITGALLVFALLVMPAAAAQQLTARPALGLILSVVIGLVVVWLGIGVSYFSVYPSGFYITTFGFAAYLVAVAFRHLWDRFGWQRSLPPVRVALPA